MQWNVAEAKRRFSELLRRAEDEPQLILNRNRVVAAVVGASVYGSFAAWRADEQRPTLGQSFEELRSICAEEDYVFDPGARRDRPNAFTDAITDSAL